MASSIRGRIVTPSSCTLRGRSVAGPADAHLGAELGQSPDVAAGDTAVQDVAADRDLEPLDPLEPVAQGENVEQALRGMLVLAVARVDDVAPDPLAEELRGTRRPVADDHHVDPHRLEISAVSTRVSPLDTDEPAVATLTVSALSRFSANSNEMRVRVDASKNRLTMVLPRRAGTFLMGRSLTSLNGSAVSRMRRI